MSIDFLPETPTLFSPAEVAEVLAVSTRTVLRWIEQGRLPAIRIGAVVRIQRTDLAAFLAQHRRDAEVPTQE